MRRRVALLSTTAVVALTAGTLAVAQASTTGGPSVTPLLAPDLTSPQVVATGLEVPWGLDFLPDGSALVTERMRGRVMRLRPGSTPEQVATISGVSATGEGGLLGLAVSPTYAQDGFVYVYFTSASDNRIVRFTLANPQNQQVILSGLQRASIHDGGRIAFGPDGMLYAGVGDAAQTGNSQNQQSLNGKILRMTPTGGVPPSGNPFPGSLVYSLGHRNVQGLAWDSAGRLYASEFGQNTWDEVNLIVAGGNYGWPTVEGMSSDTRFRNPLVTWTTAEASPSGAEIDGSTLYVAALRGQRLWTVPLTGNGGVGNPSAVLQGTYGRLRTVERAPDGSLWIATSNRDGRGSPAASDDRVIRFPAVGATPTGGPTAGPTTSPPASPTGGPTASPTASPTGGPTGQPGACSVRWEVNQWGNGFTANVSVTNGGAALNGWTVTWSFGGNQQISNAWNATVTQSGSQVTARNAAWNGSLPTGGTVTFGFQATYSGTNARPTDVRLGGTACTVS